MFEAASHCPAYIVALASNHLVATRDAAAPGCSLLTIFIAISAMKAVRLGSYSSRSTVAGTSNLATLEVDMTIETLVPTATTARGNAAVLLRHPSWSGPRSESLTGLPFQSPSGQRERAARDRGIGLYVFIAIRLRPRRHVDRVTFGQSTIGLFDVVAATRRPRNVSLALCGRVFTAITLTLNSLRRPLDLRLGRISGT